MQKMNMQLHEQQRRGSVSFQHSSACPYRFSQQSHLSAPTGGRSNLLMSMNSHPVSRLRAAKGLSRAAARSFRALRMTAGTDRKPGCLLTTVARSFATLRMTGLDLAGGEELSRAFEPCLSFLCISFAVCSTNLYGKEEEKTMTERKMITHTKPYYEKEEEKTMRKER